MLDWLAWIEAAVDSTALRQHFFDPEQHDFPAITKLF
jgi:hypothetical protein